jgi:DNA-binding SARP family transcriptional activator
VRSDVFEPSQEQDSPPLLREALAHPDLGDDERLRADLWAGLAGLLGMPTLDGARQDTAGARAAIAELVDLAAGGDPYCRARLLEARLHVDSGPAHHRDRVAWLAELDELLPPGPNALGRIQRTYWATSLAFEAGELVEVDRLLRVWEQLADRSDSAFWTWRAAMARASLRYAQGRLDLAEQGALAMGPLVEGLNPPFGLRVLGGLFFAMRHDQGRILEVAGDGSWDLGVLEAVVSVERGDVGGARRHLDRAVGLAEATGPDDLYWLCLLSLIAVAAEAVGDADRCRWVADRLDPYVDQCVMWGRSYVFGTPVAETVGQARRGAGQPEEAEAAFRRAVAWADRVGAAGFGARARVGLASVLPLDDPERATVLDEACETASRRGLGRIEREAAELVAAAVAPTERDGRLADLLAASPGPAQPSTASVRTLGRFEVVGAGGGAPARWSSRKARDALKVLICHRGRSIPREELIDLLWPDVDLATGRSRLSVVLSMLRSALDPDRVLPSDPLRSDRQSVALDLDLVAVDVEELLASAAAALAGADLGDPEAAALLAAAADRADRGTFLAEDPYADWAAGLRTTVHRVHRALLRAGAGLADTGAGHGGGAGEAIRWWTRLVELDPDDEAAYQALLALLDADGRHGEARAHRAALAARRDSLGLGTTASP